MPDIKENNTERQHREQRICDLMVAGLSLGAVVDRLNTENIPTARRATWQRSNVQQIWRRLCLDDPNLPALRAQAQADIIECKVVASVPAKIWGKVQKRCETDEIPVNAAVVDALTQWAS